MSNEEILTDDYVAGLLSQEASDCSIKYSAMGVDAFLGKDSNSKKPMNIPKPNTRFLRNIIKGTDSHNKALLAKEAAESKARLRRLERAEEIKRKKSNPTTRDIRERHMGHIQAILGGGRRRSRDGDNNDKEPDSGERAQAKGKSRDHHHGDVSGDEDQEKLHRKCSAAGHQADDSRHHRSRRHDGRRSRQRNHSLDDENRSRRRKNPGEDRSRSPRAGHRFKRPTSRDGERRRHRHRSPPRNRSPASTRNDTTRNSQTEEIGPAPPPIIRGRGAVGASSGIDRRFSASYDPRADIQGDGEANT